MESFKVQLRRHLVDHGWEVEEVLASDDWWADEFWKVQSRRNLWGFEVVLTFLVDPQWLDFHAGQRIWAIAVTEGMPVGRLEASTQSIALLVMVKGRFDAELATFGAALDTHRNEREKQDQNAEPGAATDQPPE